MRPPVRTGACDCRACVERVEREWDAFVQAHDDVADHLRRVWLNPDGTTPVQRVQEFLAASRRAGDTVFDDGA